MSNKTMSKRDAPRELAQPMTGGIDFTAAIQAAVQLGKDGVEVLERIEAMEQRQAERRAEAAFNDALGELHSRMGSVVKNCTARFTTKSGKSVQYRYADKHAIARAARDAGAGDLGLSWSWDYPEVTAESVTVSCILKHRAGHREKSTWTAPIEGGNPMTSLCQKRKIATTFAERVTLASVLGITDTEDDVDGQMPRDEDPRDLGPAVSEDQAATLQALIDETGADLARFLNWCEADSIESVPASKFAAACRALEKKRSAS